MRTFLIPLLIITAWLKPSLAQETTFCGQIVDLNSRLPVPFATLELAGKGIGSAADSSGTFCISIPDSLLEEKLLVRSLGYADSIYSIPSLHPGASKRLFLRAHSYGLQEVVVRPGVQLFSGGISAAQSRTGYLFSEWMQVALFIENPHKQRGLLQNLHFFIGDSPAFRAPFRVRIYRKSADGSPSADLLRESVIASAKKKNAWLEVPLSYYNVIIPEDGFFVAMEWIRTSPKYFFKQAINGKPISFYGQVLGNLLDQNHPALTWTYRLGESWKLDKRTYQIDGVVFRRNALIRAEVQLEEE